MGLFDAFSADTGKQYARRGFGAQKEGFNEGFELADKRITQGATQGQGFLDQGIGVQQGQLDRGNAGIDYYGQLIGLPGSGGPGVMESLKGIPGYQFAQEQGIDALNRTANSRGMLASGNNTQDILKFSQGLADQNYFNYLNSVQPYFGLGQNAAAGIQGGYTNKANLASDTGRATGALGYAAKTGIGQAKSDMYANMNNAEQAANQNLWGAILGIGNMATSALTGGLGGFGGSGGAAASGPGLAFGGGTVGPAVSGLPWLS